MKRLVSDILAKKPHQAETIQKGITSKNRLPILRAWESRRTSKPIPKLKPISIPKPIPKLEKIGKRYPSEEAPQSRSQSKKHYLQESLTNPKGLGIEADPQTYIDSRTKADSQA